MKFNAFKYALFCVCMTLLSAVSYAEDMVVEIAIEGNRYLETPSVIKNIHSKAGEPLNRKIISKDLRRLFATGYFSDVYTEGERVEGGIKLIFVVKENPVVASVTLEGNEEISSRKLKPKLKIKSGLILSPRLERLVINTIRKDYLDKGFYQVDVEINAVPLGDGRVDVVVHVDEGEVTFIKEIRFIGNQAFEDETLRNTLASRVSDLGSWFSNRDVFSKSRFEADAQILRSFYQNAGYLDAKVESTRLMLSPDKDSFYLTLSVFEGAAYTVSGVEVTGDTVPSKSELTEKVSLEVGELYSLDKLRKSISDLSEMVGDEGFAYANVTPIFKRNIEDNKVLVVFDIEKGREVYIERIKISGNEKIKDHVIRRELRQHEGERYSASNIRRSKERLKRLSYIKNVRTSTPKGSTASTADLNLDIEEGKSGSFSAGISYSQLYSYGFRGSMKENNLFGEGYQTSLTADVGGASNNYSISLTDPYFFGEDVRASMRLYQKQTDLQSLVLYTEDSQGGSVNFGFALGEYLRYSIGYNVDSTTLADVPSTSSFALRSQEGTNDSGELVQSLSYDTRDRVIFTASGGVHFVSFGYAGITGSQKFYEVKGSSKTYFPLNDDFTLRYSLGYGGIYGYESQDVPIYRRYSMGGTGSVRGYNSYGISIVDPATLDILGGNQKATSSLDMFFPLPSMDRFTFRGALFIDAGAVWGDTGSVPTSFDASQIRGSYGFGVEFLSPVGTIALVWAKAVNNQQYDNTRSFEFALGRGF